MAVSTTQSIWRSGGGDQTRTAYCGSGVMAAQFYVADVSVASATNVVVSSATGAPALILPAGAVVTEILITTDNATGETDLGFTLYTTGTNTPTGLADNATNARGVINMNAATAGASLGLAMSTSEMVYITARAGGSAGTGNISGTLIYYVTDPLVGQQNV
jgi:hypothetical protein